jgi:hypothetical protein
MTVGAQDGTLQMEVRGTRWARRIAAMMADAVLFAYAASWLVVGGLALGSPQVGGAYAVVSFFVASTAFAIAVALRLKAAGATVDALARLVLLFGSGVITNMGLPWHLLDAAGAAPLYGAAAAHAGLAADALYLWLPHRPHWLKLAALLHFTAIYPHPLEFSSRIRQALTRATVLWGAALLATLGWVFVDLLLPMPWPRHAFVVATVLIPVAAALTLANVHASYQRANPGERGRIVALLAAIVLGLTGETIFHAWPSQLLGAQPALVQLLHFAAPVGAALLIVYAVFVRGGLTPELVLQRTALYGLLSVGGVFTFSLADQILSALLVEKLGISEGFVSTLTLAGLAVAFKPAHDRLSKWLARVVRIAPEAPGAPGDTPVAQSVSQPAVEAVTAPEPAGEATSA